MKNLAAKHMYAAGNRSAVFKDRKKSFTPEIETMNTLPERSALQDIALDYDMCVMSRGTLQDFISHAAETPELSHYTEAELTEAWETMDDNLE